MHQLTGPPSFCLIEFVLKANQYKLNITATIANKKSARTSAFLTRILADKPDHGNGCGLIFDDRIIQLVLVDEGDHVEAVDAVEAVGVDVTVNEAFVAADVNRDLKRDLK